MLLYQVAPKAQEHLSPMVCLMITSFFCLFLFTHRKFSLKEMIPNSIFASSWKTILEVFYCSVISVGSDVAPFGRASSKKNHLGRGGPPCPIESFRNPGILILGTMIFNVICTPAMQWENRIEFYTWDFCEPWSSLYHFVHLSLARTQFFITNVSIKDIRNTEEHWT